LKDLVPFVFMNNSDLLTMNQNKVGLIEETSINNHFNLYELKVNKNSPARFQTRKLMVHKALFLHFCVLK